MMQAISMDDCDAASVLLGLVSLLGLLYFLASRRPKNFPPGPRGWPIVGYIPFAGKNPAETFMKMKSKYGSVISVRMGLRDWVILNDYEAINEALVKQAEKFSGRPNDFILQFISKGNGIVAADYGPTWKRLRKFGVMTMIGFGVGKKSMEDNVVEETPHLIENLLNNLKETPQENLMLAVSNALCRVLFGSRFEYTDQRFLELTGIISFFFSNEGPSPFLTAVTMAPIVRFVPPFKGAFQTFMATNKKLEGIISDIIEEHKQSFDENYLRDVIDAFLKEMTQEGEDKEIFSDDQLTQFIVDIFVAGIGTTGVMMDWAILCLVSFPEYQDKLAEEVKSVLGQDGIPTTKRRDDMPFMCAFIQELTRHRTLSPIAPLHKTNEEATIDGYTIPKDTTIGPNLWSVHMDPNYFDKPEEFRPERFLDKDGKFVKSRHVIPFSVGPRRCLGEQLARMELFIFLTGIVQKLEVLPDSAHPPPSFHTAEVPVLTMSAPRYTVKFERR